MSRIRTTVGAVMALALVVSACSSGDSEESPQTITLLAHDSFAGGATEATFASFTADTGIEVKVIAAGDAGSMVNQAILSKDNPLADVLFGVDDTFLSRALDEEIFLIHKAKDINRVPPDLVDREYRVTPIDFGDVCINYDKSWFESTQLVVPDDLADLRANLYASFLTVEHPASPSCWRPSMSSVRRAGSTTGPT